MNMPIVSICIPAYERVEITKKTIESIYNQNVDDSLFEICISDNSKNDNVKEMIYENFHGKENLVYKKSFCEGYLNSIEALKLGNGKYLKLHNNYTLFKKGKLNDFINSILKISEDDYIFFTFGLLNNDKDIVAYDSFDYFMKNISIYSTWSTAFGIWEKDFTSLYNKIEINKMFPHASLLFNLNNKKNYHIDNTEYFDNQDVGKKGGYNLPETFGTVFLSMVDELKNKESISESTKNLIRKDTLGFIAQWYLNVKIFHDKYTFLFDNWETIINQLYGNAGVIFIKDYYKKNKVKAKLRKTLKRY